MVLVSSGSMAARLCPRCASRVDERRARTVPYCPSCGAALPFSVTTTLPKKGAALPWIVAVGGVLFFLGVGVAVALVAYAKKAPEPVASSGANPKDVPRLERPSLEVKSASEVSPKVPAVASVRLPTKISVPSAKLSSTPAEPTGAFPRAKATNELDRVIAQVGSCKRQGEPTGAGSVLAGFEPDGRVSAQVAPPFGTTSTGACIASRVQSIRIGAFNGTKQQIQRSFTIAP